MVNDIIYGFLNEENENVNLTEMSKELHEWVDDYKKENRNCPQLYAFTDCIDTTANCKNATEELALKAVETMIKTYIDEGDEYIYPHYIHNMSLKLYNTIMKNTVQDMKKGWENGFTKNEYYRWSTTTVRSIMEAYKSAMEYSFKAHFDSVVIGDRTFKYCHIPWVIDIEKKYNISSNKFNWICSEYDRIASKHKGMTIENFIANNQDNEETQKVINEYLRLKDIVRNFIDKELDLWIVTDCIVK